MPDRGAFIVFEGLDKAGKSTQCERLVEELRQQGKDVIHMRFPDRTSPIGKMIDAYLKGTSELDDHAIHLLFSANRWEAAPKIRKVIEAGTWVVADRYYWSGVAFTMAKEAVNLTFNWARDCDVGLPAPDICFFLDIAPEIAKNRGTDYGEERYEKESLQKKVREKFHFIYQTEGKKTRVSIIDGGESLENVASQIKQQAQQVSADIQTNSSPLSKVLPLN